MIMRRLFLAITIMMCGLLVTTSVYAQETLRERIARRQSQQQSSEPQLSVRAQIKNQSQTQQIDNAPWIREIYRFLDLNKEKNAALYYPVNPIGSRMNLFTLIFNQFLSGNLDVYKYQLDGTEIFTDEFKQTPKDILDQFEILYKEENGKYIVENADIPSNEVLGYYIKEAWYFDKNNSVVDVKPLAICPVMFRQDDFGAESTRYPMFWIPYENIRPYAARMPIMTSSLNNASTQTINDFFIKHNFEGEIYKTTNVRDLSLAQQYPDAVQRKKEEKKIEAQLKQFNDSLWVINDSIIATQAVAKANSKGKSKKPETGGMSNNGGSIGTTNRASVQKEAKSQKSSPARSMRNRKRN